MPLAVWKMVTVGEGFSESYLLQKLITAGCEIEKEAHEYIRNSVFRRTTRVRKEVDFALLTVAELGLVHGTFQEIMQKAGELGLQVCSIEEALLLRLADCGGQEMGDEEVEFIPLAMVPAFTTYQHRYSKPSVLCLIGGAASATGKRELGVRHLSCTTADGKVLHDGEPEYPWMFVLQRRSRAKTSRP
ncbi:MAG: hypothetical protein WDZ75_01990 [Candidatus Paceibacterota bacterium]